MIEITHRVRDSIQGGPFAIPDIYFAGCHPDTSQKPIRDIPVEWFLQVVEALERLLKGELNTTALDSPVIPNVPIFQEWSHVDRHHARMFQLWVQLEREVYKPEPGENALDRIVAPPWESRDRRICAAWDELTHPNNLRALEMWYSPENMNPMAKEYTEEALRVCRKRQK